MSERWISLFLDAQAADVGAARNTLLAYGRDLKDFAAWLARHDSDFTRATRTTVEDYLIFCDAQGLSKATRARRLVSVRQFYRFLHEEGLRADNPAIRIKGPGHDRRLPDALSIEDVDRLLESARDRGRNDEIQVRNRCLLELLYATGMRVSELVGLPVAAARGDPQMLLVRGKGGKERLVPLSPPAREALANWLKIRDAGEAENEKRGKSASRFLFPGNGKLGHLTREYFFRLVQSIGVDAGIPPSRVTPHKLRHAFATHLLAGGADLRAIQMMLGHADIGTVEIYTHVLDEKLKDLVLKHHPLAQD
ncbi:site-specific tyrosine recombinase XerD [Falsirhodobacter deserti]|uniref:site-specific tyrosine recombinase XerD n=1 Tax=Falsirhodobacter deserti TaxID=1365611 RepID=UPI000FE32EBD|nr:site-specific tyrosine recombinase XerD [Falsirhodobacter deserti]